MVEGKKKNEKGNEEAGEKEDKATSESVGGEVCTMHHCSQYVYMIYMDGAEANLEV